MADAVTPSSANSASGALLGAVDRHDTRYASLLAGLSSTLSAGNRRCRPVADVAMVGVGVWLYLLLGGVWAHWLWTGVIVLLYGRIGLGCWCVIFVLATTSAWDDFTIGPHDEDALAAAEELAQAIAQAAENIKAMEQERKMLVGARKQQLGIASPECCAAQYWTMLGTTGVMLISGISFMQDGTWIKLPSVRAITARYVTGVCLLSPPTMLYIAFPYMSSYWDFYSVLCITTRRAYLMLLPPLLLVFVLNYSIPEILGESAALAVDHLWA
eukprot:gene11255-17316_t